ncbi:hypothetical protein HIM_02472 [Hirsutella minnesotensis 3608]|nr:hypothetical protein HIM_02472 [Hirsutella minnesotensis 3608]
MASAGAIWVPVALRFLRVTVGKTTKAVRIKLGEATRTIQGQTQHATIPIRGQAGRQPIHPAAVLKQQKRSARWFSSAATKNINHAVRRLLTYDARATPRADRSRYPSSNTARRVFQFSGRAPFASALRPNLTGGALPRSAGGYSLGGGARYFSHSPAAPAQVVQNVSQAMRAFFLSGQKIKYDGVGPRGHAQYRAVSKLEDEAARKLAEVSRSASGAFIDFDLRPTITAIGPLAAVVGLASATAAKHEALVLPTTLQTEGFLDVLSSDFSRVLKDLTAVYDDIRRLSALGDLPIEQSKNALRIRFPGVDAETLERLCDDIGVHRGRVGQDADFDVAIAAAPLLKLPFAPDSDAEVYTPCDSSRSQRGYDLDSDSSLEDDSFVHEAFAAEMSENPWLSDMDGYEGLSAPASSGDFEGLEGVYRFLEECDRGRGRLG